MKKGQIRDTASTLQRILEVYSYAQWAPTLAEEEKNRQMNLRQFLTFVGKVVVVHVVTTLVVGAVVYQLITKEFLEGPNPLLGAFARTPSDPELWNQVLIWTIPVQILRGFVVGAVLYPFCDTLNGWGFRKRFLSIAALWIGLGTLASSTPFGVIEGLYVLRPEFALVPVKALPEPVLQGLAFGAWIARWMVAKSQGETQEGH
ncbi:MAG: hypothetical protein SVX38_13790 [Chloroflexota bacterium]|nr:hypothetical protein [Chloroflexota bacterium]